jgi:ComF family protein
MNASLNAATRALRACLDIALPPQCLACTAETDAGGQLCPDCFSKASFISAPFCNRCGAALPGVMGRQVTPVCESCAIDPPVFRTARAALVYDDLAKRLILPFKYSDRPEAAGGLARLMLRPGAALLERAELLVPVPAHVSRLRARGYNQAGLLASRLGRLARRPVSVDALARLKHTQALGELGRDARWQALAGAIAVRPNRKTQIIGRSVLLIDDVLTSGATASACSRALLEAGAAAVDVLAIARVIDPQMI